MPRYVIQDAAGRLYTGNSVPRTDWVPRAGDPSHADPVMRLTPVFDTMNVMFALKFDGPDDAASMLTNPDLEDASAFNGCAIKECEFDALNPQAVR